jgi:D-alanyl-D-alanine carboxypeptidase/D-alanyl-D-alanine-endopeptidase (penicillin-binding protein 4)
MPASVMKIVTLATAATRLGWDYSFETQVMGVGAINLGFLDGDLLVVGSGDPSLDDWDGQATRVFQEWAEQLKAQGVRIVGGRVVGDDSAFNDERWGAGWAWDDLGTGYATGVGALQFNQNAVRLEVVPGTTVGQSAEISAIPSSATVTLQRFVTTGEPGSAPSVTTRRTPGSVALDIRGSVPADGPAVFLNVSVDNPTQYFVDQLKRALVRNGIEVRGEALDADDLLEPLNREEAVPLISHRSPPLATLATTLMRNSQNTYAESLFRVLGAPERTPEAGRVAVNDTLALWAIEATALFIVDGSGLSRYNLATAGAIVRVLDRVYDDPTLRGPFMAALSTAGVDGTLEGRMKGTRAEGRVRAKTGSFSNVRSIAGYVTTADGEPLAFCLLSNNFGTSALTIEHTADAIIGRLAEFSRY